MTGTAGADQAGDPGQNRWLYTWFVERRRLTALAVVGVSLTAILGLTRITVSNDLRDLFRTDTPEFTLAAEVARQFTADEQRVLVVVEGEHLFAPSTLSFWDYVDGLDDTVRGVRQVLTPTTASALPRLLATTSDPLRRSQVLETLHLHPMLVGRLLNTELDTALIVLDLDPQLRSLDQIDALLDTLTAELRRAAAGTGLSTPSGENDGALRTTLTGLPPLRREVMRGVQRDNWVFMVVGLLAGAAVAWVAFRHPLPALAVGVGPVLGLLWTLGAFGWLAVPIDVLNNAVPVLVLVIGMTDAVHLVRAFRDRHRGATSARCASIAALRRVGPACLLTSLTTIAGFASLGIAEARLVRVFGLTCALGLGLSFVAVTSVVTLMTGSRLGKRIPPAPEPSRAWRLLVGMGRFPRVLAIAGLLITAATGSTFLDLEFDYQYREYLPADSEVRAGLETLDSRLGGSLPVHVVVDWNGDASSAQVDAALRSVVAVLGHHQQFSKTVSPLDLLPEGTSLATGLQSGIIDAAPPALRRSVLHEEIRRALVTSRMAGGRASATKELLETVEAELAEVEEGLDGVRLTTTGLWPLSSRTSLRMLRDLTGSLLLAAVVILSLLTLGLRSLRWGVLSLVPNLLPLGAIGAFLRFTDRPLQFTTVTLLSVVLGLAVDDSVHLLVDLRQRCGAARERMRECLRAVGPSLLTTTALLAAGFGSLVLSREPMMRLFGGLGLLAFAVALIADLLLLPALMLAWGNLDRDSDAGAAQSGRRTP